MRGEKKGENAKGEKTEQEAAAALVKKKTYVDNILYVTVEHVLICSCTVTTSTLILGKICVCESWLQGFTPIPLQNQ